MASGVYGLQLAIAINKTAGQYDLNADTLKSAMVTNTHTPDFDAHNFFDDVTNEISGTGYTAGGPTRTTVTSAAASGFYKNDADDISLTTSTLTSVRGDVLYSTAGGSSAADALVMGRTYGADYSTVAGTFAVTEPANGLWRVDYIP